jgi:hypothetical protein
MDTKILSVAGLILVILIALMLGCSGVDAYTSANSALKEYPYEGFQAIQNAFEARYAEAFRDDKKKYAEAFEASESPPIKVGGFAGLMGAPFGKEKIIGFMYNNDSNTTCKPYGYTNSKGNICLSDSDIRLLTTRGGNAGGSPDQIGK